MPNTGTSEPRLAYSVLRYDYLYSWYQPAIDAFGHALMGRFNKISDHHGLTSRWMSGPGNAQAAELQPVVYVTYQAYLRR